MYELAYSRPHTLDDALALLAEDEGAQALSGGQTLMPVLRARLAMPTRLVDLQRLPELAGIKAVDGGIEIGAATTHAEVAASAEVRAVLPALADLAGGIGDPAIRHRGTIGGSIANNDPAACYPSALLALGASVTTSQRTLAADDFFTGMFSTALEPGEIVTAVRLPACSRAAYIKFRNPASRFALVGAFVAHLPSGTRIAITGGGHGVFRWHEAEQHLDGGGAIAEITQDRLDLGHFTGDLHGSAEYRRHVAAVIVRRALSALA
jgi:carbon-monoxide dehydrogenase medium subunit